MYQVTITKNCSGERVFLVNKIGEPTMLAMKFDAIKHMIF